MPGKKPNTTLAKSRIGLQFGRLTVVGFSQNKWGQVAYECACICGGTKRIMFKSLADGASTSCGCFNREVVISNHTSHGKSKTAEYQAWQSMKRRCVIKTGDFWKNYGSRGIAVCKEWLHSFGAFFADMGVCPDGRTLDRLDNDGPYNKENCRWATDLEQAQNKRNNHRVTYKGKTQCVSAWDRERGFGPCTIQGRLRKGWSIEDAIEIPAYPKLRYTTHLKNKSFRNVQKSCPTN